MPRVGARIALIAFIGIGGQGLPNRTFGYEISVSDSIGMTQFGSPGQEYYSSESPAVLSPDGQRFVVVVRRGNEADNTNDYKLLMFSTDRLGGRQTPAVLLSVSTGTNEPGIHRLRWLEDSRTLLLVAAADRGIQQGFALDTSNKVMRQLTHHPTDVIGIDAAADLHTVVYVAKAPRRPVLSAEERQQGIALRSQTLTQLLTGSYSDNVFLTPPEFFIRNNDGKADRIVLGNARPLSADIALSPNGRFVLLGTDIFETEIPDLWAAARERFRGWGNIPMLTLVDLKRKQARPLLAGEYGLPGGMRSDRIPFVWSDEGSHVIANTYIRVMEGNTPSVSATPFVAEIDIHTGEASSIAQGRCVITYWNIREKILVTASEVVDGKAQSKTDCGMPEQAFQKKPNGWRSTEGLPPEYAGGVRVRIEQNMNSPPRLVATGPTLNSATVILDPNPQFHDLQFAHVEEISFSGTDGTKYRAGLYWPPSHRGPPPYPLVIQTHGWDPNRWAMDGESTAGYAAQTLATNGILVAQLPFAPDETTPNEGPQNLAAYEGVINALVREGAIDADRVGLLGWSRTVFHVRYALSFAKFPIKAALVVDGIDGGYMEYVAASGDTLRFAGSTLEALKGRVPPFGDGLAAWIQMSPSFNLGSVRSPLLQVMLGENSYISMWESWAGLQRLGKPVEMLWLPDSNHWPLRPSERRAVQEGAVDWFRFWLQDYQDSSTSKLPQYVRWQVLRSQQKSVERPSS